MGDESMQQAKEVQQQQQRHSRLLARGWLAVGKALTTLSSTMLPDRAQYVDRVGRLSVTNGLGACHANCHFLSRSAQSAGGVNPGVIQLGTKGRVLLWSGSMLCPHNVQPSYIRPHACPLQCPSACCNQARSTPGLQDRGVRDLK